MSKTGVEHPYFPRELSMPHYVPNDKSPYEILGVFGGAVGVVLILMYILTGRFNHLKNSFITRLKLCWFLNSAIVHIIIEGYYVYYNKTLAGHMTFLGQLWKEYSKADSRYLTSDTFTLCMETVTVVVDGPLCVLVVILFLARQRHRFVVQLVVSLMQLYGDVLYFSTEIMDEFPNSRYGHPLYFYFYFVFMNTIWIVLPVLCIMEAVCALGSSQNVVDNSKQSVENKQKRKIKNK